MQEGKQNELSNFTKLLRKLQIDNVTMPELRQLKQEHAYLEKLKLQRFKIEELKEKYDQAEMQVAAYEEDLTAQKELIEEQHRTIQHLQTKLEESQRRRNQLEVTLARNTEIEREKQRAKNNELLAEVEELRKENKSKDLLIFQMEDEIQRKTAQLKQQFQFDRKKIATEWEQKIKTAYAERNSKDQEVEELKQLVTRQHKALQMQNEQFEESSRKNDQLTETVNNLEEELGDALRMKEEAEERVSELVQLVGRMETELAERRSGQTAKDQVEELRKKMSEMAKGEIQRIEFIVSEFE